MCNPSQKYIKQYADKVLVNGKIFTAPQLTKRASSDEMYLPGQMTGPPDVAERCTLDGRSWVHNSITDGEQPRSIEVTFKRAVVPIGLKLWIINDAKDSISDVVLVHTDGAFTSLGNYLVFSIQIFYQVAIEMYLLTRKANIIFLCLQ